MCNVFRWLMSAVLLLGVVAWDDAAAQESAATTYGLGRTVTLEEVRDWGSNISPTGDGLPPGGATAASGRRTYARQCARCHGMTGTEGPDHRLAGGKGGLASDAPLKTVGSYWPLATTLWDYVNRAMPFDQPGGLAADEVYGSVAYVLFLNEIIGEADRMDALSLPQVQMPNRDGFVSDPRPDVHLGARERR